MSGWWMGESVFQKPPRTTQEGRPVFTLNSSVQELQEIQSDGVPPSSAGKRVRAESSSPTGSTSIAEIKKPKVHCVQYPDQRGGGNRGEGRTSAGDRWRRL
eukprot:TRINITY_DN3294_c0_g1_i3.p3 TRINITY_DN3294_c0_g1~~TRINITY_DN3294_c0_g1_i3.p3  ORF type:complete len:101 (+),score=7.73 TRINITY_DN3294_c0_g1_i3:62-364(+)